MVTAELAVTTLAAFAVLMMMCWGIYLVVTQLRCVDAAAAVARQAARADAAAVVKAEAGAPTGATIMIDKRPNLVTVTVRVRARPLGRWMAAVPLEAGCHQVSVTPLTLPRAFSLRGADGAALTCGVSASSFDDWPWPIWFTAATR